MYTFLFISYLHFLALFCQRITPKGYSTSVLSTWGSGAMGPCCAGKSNPRILYTKLSSLSSLSYIALFYLKT